MMRSRQNKRQEIKMSRDLIRKFFKFKKRPVFSRTLIGSEMKAGDRGSVRGR